VHTRLGLALHRRPVAVTHVRPGLEIGGRPRAHRTAQHRRGTLGPWVREADVLLADGGDAAYLCHWMRQSGLADLLPSLQDTVWVGVSAGSMVMTPRIGDDFVNWTAPAGGDSTLGVVDFSIFPHLGDMPGNTMAAAERWAAEIAGPAYAMDDQTAIKVSDGTVEVISEGHWKLFPA
jgi:dipeptidase E